MAVQPQKRIDLPDDRQNALKNDFSGRREFERLVYPATRRPVLKYKEHEFQVIDISEKGIKLSNDKQIDLGRLVYGEVKLLCGRSINVDGEIAWSLNNEVGLLMSLIPSSIIAEEKRILSRKKKQINP